MARHRVGFSSDRLPGRPRFVEDGLPLPPPLRRLSLGRLQSFEFGVEVVVGQGEHRLAAHRAGLALDQLVDQPFSLLDRSGPVERAGRFVKAVLGLIVERSGFGFGCLRTGALLGQIVEFTGEPGQLSPLIADPAQLSLVGTVGDRGGRGFGCLSGRPGFTLRGRHPRPDRLG